MNDSEQVLTRSTTDDSTFGEQLRYYREKKGFSQQEVANALCLNVKVIDDLERDDYTAIGAPVFVKGYLKNYARFLSLPIAELSHQMTAPIDQATTQTQVFSFKHPLLKQYLRKGINFLIVIVFISLVSIWWFDKHRAAEKISAPVKVENSQ